MNEPFETLSREPAYRRVAAAIAGRITGRQLTDGDPLPTELDLAAQFGVTRSTVREALRELESNGLLERRRGSKRLIVTRPATAALVARVSHALALHDVTVREVWEALTILEPPTAELAARTRRAGDLERINTALEGFLASRSTTAAVAAVAEFFDAVDAASGNRALLLAQRPLLPLLSSSLKLTIDRVPQARTRIVLAQRKLRDAITAGDSAAAREWMAKHIRDFRRGFEVAGIKLSTPVKVSAP
ncbi:MAG TPA: GntR family transcriptional regulator [Steroidobacteraceae bacterium]|nr:GntR family transcriptional regulator [Steroidobacteraceae bacterium]